VPAKKKRPDRILEEALAALAAALDRTGVPWMIIGGIAVIARGVRRLTTDIDATVRGDGISVERLAEVLAQHDITPRIDDGLSFARQNLVFLLRHSPTGVDLDVSLAWSSFEHEALEARAPAHFGVVVAPMSSAEDLVVYKAIAARPKDLDDAEALLSLHPSIDRGRVRARVVELASLAEAPELVSVLDALLARTDPP
jgi:hypothetical protein